MFQTSFDGGDIVSITSVFDNENKKPIAGILKTKRNSIKRKVQHFSLESDDGVIEPLLQKVKESTEIGNQSAKNLLSKKTDSVIEKGDDKDKLLADKKSGMPSMTSVPSVTNNAYLVNGTNSMKISTKSNGSTITDAHKPMHNYMYTNVYSNNNTLLGMSPPKSQILVEIESTKLSGYSPSPLIFTTAKIHTDGKSKQMEPVQVTTVPILSTFEGNVIKTEALTDYSTGANETFRSDKEQNTQVNKYSKNQVSAAPFSCIANNISSDTVAKKCSVNKVIVTSSTSIQVSQVSKTIDVKSVPLTSIINITQSAQLKSEQSTKTSLTQIQEMTKPTVVNEKLKSALEKNTPLMYNTKTDNSILRPCTSSENGIHKTDNMTKVIEMDINKNIQSTNTITSPEPGTSNQDDSSSNAKAVSDSSVTDRFTRQASNSLSDKKILSKKYETADRCFEPGNRQTVSNSNKTEKTSSSKLNSDRNLASNKSNSLNLKSCVVQSTAKSITPSNTTAVSSAVSSVSCTESSHTQTVATTSKATTIIKGSPVFVAKSLTTDDTISSSSNAVKITTASANTNVSNSDKTQSMASVHTTSSASAVSKSLTVSTVKTPAVIKTCQSSTTTTVKNTKTSVAKPLNTSAPVAVAVLVKMTTTSANSNVTSTIKSQSAADTKSTYTVSQAVSKPATVAITKTPVITSQSTTAAAQTSSKSTLTNVKSKAAPRMSQTSTAKSVAGSASTIMKPSTVTTMKSSAGQKVNTSTTSKLGTPKSAAAVVSTSSTIKKVTNEQNDKKAGDGFSKDKGSKA